MRFKMNTLKFWIISLLSLLTFLYHGSALAAFDDVFYRNPADMSIGYLGDIFGIVGNALVGQGNSVLAAIFRIFNIVVLSLGTITVMYTVVASTMNTAQEGEVMGKKWSSMWLPLRSAGGLALLLPTSSGYSLIQILMMTIILKGVDAGNAVYNTVLDRAGEGQSIGAPIQTVNKNMLATQTKNAFKIASCAAYLNQHSDITGGYVAPYREGERINIGIEDNPAYKAVCGSITMAPNPNTSKINADAWKEAQFSSAEAALSVASSPAEEAMNPDPNFWVSNNPLVNIARAMKSPLVSVPISTSSNFESILAKSKQAGWLFAGVNYFRLLSPEGVQNYRPSPPNFPSDLSNLNNLGIQVNGKNLGNYIQEQSDAYLLVVSPANIASTEGSSMLSAPPTNSGDANTIISSSGLGDTFESIRNNLVVGEGDALSSMRKIGTDIMQGLETAFWVMLGVTIGMALLACIMAGQSPLCSGFLTLITLLIPVLLFFMTLLWSVGVLLGLYIPMIPYLVFTFSALAWFIMVIEAIVAAPIVSLGLVTPSGENLGKASGAVLLIANIFMRPSLMVIGLVIAAKLLNVAVQMLNFGFNYFMSTIGGSNYGFFASIALLIVYGGIVIALTHECFTLIHVLPDKVNRWIGGQAEQSGVAKQMGEMQKSVQQASQTSMQMMQAGTKAIGEVKTVVEKIQETKSGGGGGGGAGQLP
jgi:conjugal transfer/type IV secretion protein DotA/TraY